jgi:hypothetical protein
MKLLDEIRAYNGTLNYEGLHKLVEDLNNRINSTVSVKELNLDYNF